MKNKHPIHQTYAENLIEINGNVELYDCRLRENQPFIIESLLVLFSNPFKAAKFIKSKKIDRGEDFTSKRFTTDEEVFSLINRLNLLGVAIDPCPTCDWFDPIGIENQKKFRTEIYNKKQLNLGQIESIKKCAQRLISEKEFGEAMDVLIAATAHIDCSNVELHFMLGISAFYLNDQENLNLALDNLKILSPKKLIDLKIAMKSFSLHK